LFTPPLRDAVGRLSPRIRSVVAYHLGWQDADGADSGSDGGKAVRPSLVFASATAVGGRPEDAIPGAVAVELIHNFSLLHDDVMDEDVERRHRPTAWTLFGIGEAILAGDALHALAQEMLIDPPSPERLLAASALADATAAMISGQSEDLEFESRDDVTVDECLTMLGHKTAALVSGACRIGAVLGGGAKRSQDALGEFGFHLGLSYQAVDDVLGIWGEPSVTGKPAWSDLRQHKKTLPVVAALTTGAPAAVEQLRAFLSAADEPAEEDVAMAGKLIEENGGRDIAMEEATRRLGAAMQSLDRIEVASEARRDLEEIAGFITAREF
jgi:geranylgeranyl diphosphate synthase type I